MVYYEVRMNGIYMNSYKHYTEANDEADRLRRRAWRNVTVETIVK